MLGTQNNSFHRLLEEIEKLIVKKQIQEEVVVQAGYTKYETENMKVFDLIPKQKLEKCKKKQTLLLHMVVQALLSRLYKKEKKIIAVARRHEYGEHVNNHQEEIVDLFDQKGYIIGINQVSDLENAMKKIPDFKPKKYQSNNQKMLKIIEEFIEKV